MSSPQSSESVREASCIDPGCMVGEGGELLEIEHGDEGSRVTCPCGVCGPWMEDPDEANAAWDRLLPTPASEPEPVHVNIPHKPLFHGAITWDEPEPAADGGETDRWLDRLHAEIDKREALLNKYEVVVNQKQELAARVAELEAIVFARRQEGGEAAR